ncbi:MAG: helix-turn-helix domain-containing protein [Spirochaetaceae bacterium]|nr:helix-turn-helix domain-containing protein [Spirochaetaceae bacterium]
MAETFEIILVTASRLFEERGYSATSVREIAEASGIAKATIYHHFTDKEKILLTLVERGQAAQEALLSRLEAEADPRRRLEAAVRETLGFLSANMTLMQAARRETAGGRELVTRRFLPGISRLRELTAEAIAAGTVSGAFRAIDPARAASVLVAMIQGSYAGAHLAEERLGISEDMVAAILGVFFKGIDRR